MSSNLNIPQWTEAQAHPEVTTNNGIAALDAALTETFNADLTSGNVSVTAAQYRGALYFRAINVATGGRTVTLPAVKRLVHFSSPAANTNDISLIRGSTTITVSPGQELIVVTDGTANGLTRTVVGGGASDADYLVKTAHAGLSAERVVTDTTSVVWDWATGGQAKATVPNEFIDDRVASLLVAGTNITLTYNDGANTLTIDGGGGGLTNENVDDRVAALLVAGTNVTLSYNDAGDALTISASGAGASLPDEPALVLPTLAVFSTAVDKTTGAGLTGTASDESYGIKLLKNNTNTTNSNQWLMRLKAVPVTTDWTITAMWRRMHYVDTWRGSGLMMRESATNKVVALAISTDVTSGCGLVVARWTADGDTFGTNIKKDNGLFWGGARVWARVRYVNSSSTYFYEASPNGTHWFTLFSETKTSSFTTAANQWGFGINSNSVAGNAASCEAHFLHYAES